MLFKNRIREFEKDLCRVLAQICYHIHPDIVRRIQRRNQQDATHLSAVFAGRVDLSHYLFPGSACVFPGVRRYVSGQGTRRAYNGAYRAIIDDNEFPRHIWCYLEKGKPYSGPVWKESGLSAFELAHIFTHKETEIASERRFFSEFRQDLFPHGDFSCACNVILLPKGTVRPTDNSPVVKAIFYKRYIDLYGEEPLNGRRGFNEDLIPRWYSDLVWNEPILPPNWESSIDRLFDYRNSTLARIMSKAR